MGYIEDIEALDLADDVKQRLIAGHRAEVDPLRAASNKTSVATEVDALGSMGFEEAPGLLKFARRVFLSPDAQEPGAVLLSDSEMNLSGEEATGATGREEMSGAQILRTFISLMPTNDQGRVNLSDQAVETGGNEPPPKDGDKQEKTEGARERLGSLTGKDLSRKSRSKRYGTASVTAGDVV